MDQIQAEGISGQIMSAMLSTGITPRHREFTRNARDEHDISVMMSGSANGSALIMTVRVFSFLGRPKAIFTVNGQAVSRFASQSLPLPDGKYNVVSGSGYFEAQLGNEMRSAQEPVEIQLEKGMEWFKFFTGSPRIDLRFRDMKSINFMPLIDWRSAERKAAELRYGEAGATVAMCALVLKQFPAEIFSPAQDEKINKFAV